MPGKATIRYADKYAETAVHLLTCIGAHASLFLAFTVVAQAAQAISINLLQVGGTYNGVFAHSGDTLVLQIVVSLTGDPSIGAVDPASDYDPSTAARTSEGSLEIGLNACCSSISSPSHVATFAQLVTFDTGEVAPGHSYGYGMRVIARGATGFGSFSPGRIGLVLTGLSGTISTSGTVGLPFGTSILDADGNDITSTAALGSFEVVGTPIPEPSTFFLVALGLLALLRRPTSR